MLQIRIGLGQTPSGKILDSETTCFIITADRSEKQAAIEQHDKTGKPIFVKVYGKAYRQITREQLVNLPDRHGKIPNCWK